jgi:cystathionine beta-lyase/cystathionine gamma-synthase
MSIPTSTSDSLPATLAVRGGFDPDDPLAALTPAICQSTTFAQQAVGQHAGFTYSRAANPTVACLERALAGLEGDAHATATGSGMGAITTLALAVLAAGDHVVCSDVVYGGTVRLLTRFLSRLGIRSTFADTSDQDATRRALQPKTRLVLIETPANPTLTLTDIAATASLAHDAGALLAVDNTFLTPLLQSPLNLGADVAVYSTTKFIEGHNTAVGGALLTRDAELAARLVETRKSIGSIQSPFGAWLTLKGLQTLPLRLERHTRSALEVALWLERHPTVARVHYPDLPGFPQRELALRQQRGGGGVLSFEVAGDDGAAVRVMNALRFCVRAENLGTTETLATHPVSMTHGAVPREHRERVGIRDGLIRLSVGLENPEAILNDLDQALDCVHGGRPTKAREVVA